MPAITVASFGDGLAAPDLIRSLVKRILCSNNAERRLCSANVITGTNPAAMGYAVQTQPSLDNNTVDLDRERANSVDNAVRYEAALRFINGTAKTMLSAIQGQ